MKGLVYETSVLDPDEVSFPQKWHKALYRLYSLDALGFLGPRPFCDEDKCLL